MNTVYTVLGMITFWSIVAYVIYEYVYPTIRVYVDAVRFLRWYDREAKRVNPEHTYKIGLVQRYAEACSQMAERNRCLRAGMTFDLTHHSGAKFN